MARTNVTNINAEFHAEVVEKIKEFAESLDTGLTITTAPVDRDELKNGYFGVTLFFGDSEWESAIEKAINEIGKKARAGQPLTEEKKTVTKTATIGGKKAAAPTVALKTAKIAKVEPVQAKPKFSKNTIAKIVAELHDYTIELANEENVMEALSSVDAKINTKFKNQIKKVSQLAEIFEEARENGVNELIAFLSLVDFDAESKPLRALIDEAREIDENLIPTDDENSENSQTEEENEEENEEKNEEADDDADGFLDTDEEEEEEVQQVVNKKRK